MLLRLISCREFDTIYGSASMGHAGLTGQGDAEDHGSLRIPNYSSACAPLPPDLVAPAACSCADAP